MMRSGDNWRMNKYGKKETLIAVKSKNGKYPKGYMRMGSKVYAVTCSPGKKDDRNGNEIRYWVSITETDFRN